MMFEGQIHKMITEDANPIQYYLDFSSEFVAMNQLIGRDVRLRFDHYQCLGCNQDLEIFRMGYCKNCFFTLPQANESIIRPELSTAHLGIEQRDLEWEMKFELQPHIVYLANSAGLKVGVTRKTQIPTRWIDQGASFALVVARTENRYQAGVIEVALKAHLADKTNYQKMLKNMLEEVDLIAEFEKVKQFVPEDQQVFLVDEPQIYAFEYPVLQYPTKIKSVNLKKDLSVEGKLVGIKGQYLIFHNGRVLNVRSHEGFYLKLEV
ncbi:DUF2797 domain-containing protein [Vaginella massiliensis]|uniref:DUF2797 domain-containing protein n=1 Tax=Vaginella massiliensis TaxID=1816680 RepID=UPI000838DA12|nr:DUF2797 domain-containing protein [Vaginella massiliensis]